mgnify:CR=1 FL=1
MTEELEPFYGSVLGTVTDLENGELLEGAKVVIEYHDMVRTTFTDSEGEYRFDQVPECFCLKKVTASMDHYRPETEEVGVSGETVVDFALMIEEMQPEDGTLSGVVYDAETGEPIEGASLDDDRILSYLLVLPFRISLGNFRIVGEVSYGMNWVAANYFPSQIVLNRGLYWGG